MEILQGCECHYDGTEDCGLRNAEYLCGSLYETWECSICGHTFKVPTELEYINGEIDCDTIERLWDEGETIISTNHQYQFNFNGSN